MGGKSFTLMEILVTLVILSILATLGFPAYQTVIENQKAKVCQANLEAIGVALDVYAMEHDAMPGDLSQIPEQYLQKGFAKMMQKKGAWEIKLAYHIVGLQQRGLAYAGLLNNLARGNQRLLTCPADNPANYGRSYKLSENIKSLTSAQYKNLTDGTILIGDCSNAVLNSYSDLTLRHKTYSITGNTVYAYTTTKVTGGPSEIVKYEQPVSALGALGGASTPAPPSACQACRYSRASCVSGCQNTWHNQPLKALLCIADCFNTYKCWKVCH